MLLPRVIGWLVIYDQLHMNEDQTACLETLSNIPPSYGLWCLCSWFDLFSSICFSLWRHYFIPALVVVMWNMHQVKEKRCNMSQDKCSLYQLRIRINIAIMRTHNKSMIPLYFITLHQLQIEFRYSFCQILRVSSFHTVAQESDFHDDMLGFHPEFTHQVFGEQ